MTEERAQYGEEKKIDDGGPAFPGEEINLMVDSGCKKCVDHLKRISPFKTIGLTKREWFAGMSLYGVLSTHGYVTGGSERASKMAYEMADAMIRAGKESQK